ncbi:hypothetical protein T492DRAFT_911420, partial [Pavlovales sp. CCMP2436]
MHLPLLQSLDQNHIFACFLPPGTPICRTLPDLFRTPFAGTRLFAVAAAARLACEMSLLRTMMEDTIMRNEAQALIQLVGVFAIIDVTEIIPEVGEAIVQTDATLRTVRRSFRKGIDRTPWDEHKATLLSERWKNLTCFMPEKRRNRASKRNLNLAEVQRM